MFSVKKDRAYVAVVLQSILKKKLILCIAQGDFVNYRLLGYSSVLFGFLIASSIVLKNIFLVSGYHWVWVNV